MNLTLQEAAILMDISPRTLRARAQRGDVAGSKTARGWSFDHRTLPLTDAQRARLQQRADALRDVIDHAIPGRMSPNRETGERTLLDLDAFRLGMPVLVALRTDPNRSDAARELEAALLEVAEASFVYDRNLKLAALNRARAHLGRCVARLLLLGSPTDLGAARTLEHDLQPAINGYARWAAGLGERHRR